MSGKLHWFRFSWGYVEDARVAILPTWWHVGGFDTAVEAAESFQKALASWNGATLSTCSKHGRTSSKVSAPFCSQCGEKMKQVPHPDAALRAFDSLYTATAEEYPSSESPKWDESWLAEWEFSEPPDQKPVLIERFDAALYENDMEELMFEEV